MERTWVLRGWISPTLGAHFHTFCVSSSSLFFKRIKEKQEKKKEIEKRERRIEEKGMGGKTRKGGKQATLTCAGKQ